MKKCKNLIGIMCISILLSGIIIFMCESSFFLHIRIFIKQYIAFFDGKKAVIENICIGIFASSLIALIGYIFEYKNEKSSLKLEIIKTFKNVYFEYYELIGDNNINDIREKFMKDDVISRISYCSIEYGKDLFKKNDVYSKAIGIMKWTELYYTNLFCVYAALCEIKKYIYIIKNDMKEVEKWEDKDLIDQYLHDNQGRLSDLKKCYDDILAEMKRRINDNLKEKKKKDCNEMIEIKNKFGILDDGAVEFVGNICYIREVWKEI